MRQPVKHYKTVSAERKHIRAMVHPTMMKYVEKLLDTGLYGKTPASLIEHLIAYEAHKAIQLGLISVERENQVQQPSGAEQFYRSLHGSDEGLGDC